MAPCALLTSSVIVTPFAASCQANRRCSLYARRLALQCAAHTRAQQQAASSQAVVLPAAAWASLVPGLTAASWAASATIAAAPAAAAEEAAPEAAGAALQAAAEQVAGGDLPGAAAAVADQLGGTDPGNVVISILFTTAVAALTVLTLGVAYLSFTSWNDSRIEAEDRKKAGGLSPVASGSRQPGGGGSSKKAKKSAAEEPANFKGFGPRK